MNLHSFKRFRTPLLLPLLLLPVITWFLRDPIRNLLASGIVGAGAPLLGAAESPARNDYNGFDLAEVTIPKSEILSGGPPRDGIPSIDMPVFISPDQATFMEDVDLVVSVTLGGETRAYPLRILVWHEIVNDVIAGIPIAVTYCPLCGTAMVFDRTIEKRVLTLGVSGLLYQSDVLMYDRETGSLWSQLKMQAVSGELVRARLPWRASEHLAWAAWKGKHPRGKVLSTETGHERDYSQQPYGRYEEDPGTLFPVPVHRDELPQKEWVLGVVNGSEAKAYRLSALPLGRVVSDMVGGSNLEVSFNPATQDARVLNINRGEPIPFVKVYWFAWQAFHPETGLWQGE